MAIIPRKCTREEIEADPRWRESIKPLFLLMYELGVEEVTLRKDGKQCHSSITPDGKQACRTKICPFCSATNEEFEINCWACDCSIEQVEPN